MTSVNADDAGVGTQVWPTLFTAEGPEAVGLERLSDLPVIQM